MTEVGMTLTEFLLSANDAAAALQRLIDGAKSAAEDE